MGRRHSFGRDHSQGPTKMYVFTNHRAASHLKTEEKREQNGSGREREMIQGQLRMAGTA